MTTIQRVVQFVQSHPGFYCSHDDHGVVLQIEAVDRSGDRWTEYMSVWSIAGAREALGY